jgi:hypothetical protein
MSTTIRLPYAVVTAGQPAESALIITLLNGVSSLLKGGAENYVSIAPWHQANVQEAQYTDVVIEFLANGALLVGDGSTAQTLGLFGEDFQGQKTLLGVLGSNLGATVPQIPIISTDVSYTQKILDVAMYAKLSVGTVFGDLALGLGVELTVIARPIRRRNFVG